MFKITFTTLFLLACMGEIYSQINQGSAIYSVTTGFKIPDLDLDSGKVYQDKEKRAIEYLSAFFDSGKDVQVQLIFNSFGSFVRPVNALTDELSSNIAAVLADEIIYTDYSSLTTYTIDESLGEPIVIIDSLNRFKWVLTNEKKKIQGYTCLKALGIRNVERDNGSRESQVEAWYTPQIPIPTGPAGYGGLPGLILELRESKSAVYVLLKLETSIPQSDLNLIQRPKKGQEMSRNDFNNLLDSIDDR
ncbi:GLPGLI family protein [Roseivirga sp.]|uniref:GLPGLI family protein n=1 Tax=Roseivirga sp. TaxID=1964215 RepID=UPI003B51DED4